MVIPFKLKDHNEKPVTAVIAFWKIKLHFVLFILSTLECCSVRAIEAYRMIPNMVLLLLLFF